MPGSSGTPGPGGSSWTGRLVSIGVVVLVIALAAATFVLSYSGVRDLAMASGVSPRLARLYPAVLDGVLVVACAAVFVLREGALWRRIYAWFSVILLIAIIGAADAIHAMNVALPRRPAEGTAAALPWALVMLGFSLWLTMLRHPRRTAVPPLDAVSPVAAASPTVEEPPPAAEPPAAEPPRAELSAAELSAAEPPAAASPSIALPVLPALPAALPTDAAEPADAAPELPQPPETSEPPAAEPQESQPSEAIDPSDVIAPRLHRVRSTPVPPAD
jgi:hypothetical protein